MPGMMGAATALGLALIALLPFHRPPLTSVLGPSLALPDAFFLPAAIALLLSGSLRSLRTSLALGGALVVGFLPSLVDAVSPRSAAAQLLVLLYVVPGLYTVGALLARRGARDAALKALLAGALAACLLGLIGALLAVTGNESLGLARVYPLMPVARPVGPTESPNMLALIAACSGFAALDLWRRDALARGTFIGVLLVLGVTLLAAQSRMAVAAAAGAGVLWALRSARPSGRVLGLGLTASAVAVIVASVAWRVVPLQSEWPFIDAGPSMYWVCHDVAWRTFLSDPLTGVGLECFQDTWPQFYDPARHDAAFAGGAESYLGLPRDPHGTLQGYLAEAGLPALAVLLGLGWCVWRGRLRDCPEVPAVLVFLLVASITTDVLTKRSLWVLLGLLSATPGRGPHVTWRRRTSADSASSTPGERTDGET